MDTVYFTQQELRILVNLIYQVQLRIPDARLVIPLVEKLESKIVKEEPKEPVLKPVVPETKN
jgi:hypothetical protein